MKRALNLLLVEDNKSDAAIALAELHRYGYDVTFEYVEDAVGLRDALAAGAWEIVLCDHHLPGFGSMEALAIVCESGVDVPFVILSGVIGEEAAVDALKAGARDVVLKHNLSRIGPVVDRELREAANRRDQRQLEREQAELQARLVSLNEELRVREEQYRLLFEQNPLPAVVYDRATLEIMAVNSTAIRSYGYSQEEFLAMKITDLPPPEDVGRVLAFLAANPGGRQPHLSAGFGGSPWRQTYKDGTSIEVEVTSASLTYAGRECRLALFHDVTERNQAIADLAVARDQAIEASKIKSAFLANMSHEIRTPMNGVIGMTDVLLDTHLTDEQRECAEHLALASEQMMAIIGDVLDITKIEAGQLELHETTFALHKTIEQACAAARQQARAKGIEFQLQIDPALARTVRGDRTRIRQVLQNLLSNAVKFTDTGTVAVRVNPIPGRDDPGAMRCEVIERASASTHKSLTACSNHSHKPTHQPPANTAAAASDSQSHANSPT